MGKDDETYLSSYQLSTINYQLSTINYQLSTINYQLLMAIFSPLRSRRLAARKKKKAEKQAIAFRLRNEWFAIPIEVVQKVVPLGNVYGDPRGTGVSLTIYQGKELLVVDVGHRIFVEPRSVDSTSKGDNFGSDGGIRQPEERYLLIVEISTGELVGLPIDSPPSIRRIAESSFTPLPAAYVTQGNIQCVSSMIIEQKDSNPLFLLNPEQLAAPHNIIPEE